MEQEPTENLGMIAEVADTKLEDGALTPFQEHYLKTEIDPEIDRLIANMEAEKVRRRLSDEYQMRVNKQISEL